MYDMYDQTLPEALIRARTHKVKHFINLDVIHFNTEYFGT